MHVYHDGEWHRRTPDLSATACGKKFNSQFSRTRREELTHPLAKCCFTEHERHQADLKKAAEDFEERVTSQLFLVDPSLEGEDK